MLTEPQSRLPPPEHLNLPADVRLLERAPWTTSSIAMKWTISTDRHIELRPLIDKPAVDQLMPAAQKAKGAMKEAKGLPFTYPKCSTTRGLTCGREERRSENASFRLNSCIRQ